MWCSHCHQEVPAVASAAGRQVVCARCQRELKFTAACGILDSGIELGTVASPCRETTPVRDSLRDEEAKLAGKEELEIVVPSLSILAEPPVAVVDKVAAKHGTTEVAKAYLEHLYSPQGQQLAAKHYYRPAIANAITPEQRDQFTHVELFKINDVFGDWRKAQKEHFDDGGVFDQIYQPGQ